MIVSFKFFQSVSGKVVKYTSAALQNMHQNHLMLSTNDLEQQQISTHIRNTTEDDQRLKQSSKVVAEPEDARSTARCSG